MSIGSCTAVHGSPSPNSFSSVRNESEFSRPRFGKVHSCEEILLTPVQGGRARVPPNQIQERETSAIFARLGFWWTGRAEVKSGRRWRLLEVPEPQLQRRQGQVRREGLVQCEQVLWYRFRLRSEVPPCKTKGIHADTFCTTSGSFTCSSTESSRRSCGRSHRSFLEASCIFSNRTSWCPS